MSPIQNQYQYKTVFSNGRWGVLMENDSGSWSRLLTERASELEARATMEYMQTCRTRRVTSPRMEDKWF